MEVALGIRAALARPRTREVVGITLTGSAVMLVVALATYSPNDPSFFTTTGRGASNWIGPVGAQLSALLYALFGLAAWLIPLVLLAGAMRQVRGTRHHVRRGAVIGMCLVAVSTALLLALTVGAVRFRGAELTAGGLLGDLLESGLVALFSEIGAGIVTGTLMLAGLALSARSSLAETTAELVDAGRSRLVAVARPAGLGAPAASLAAMVRRTWDRVPKVWPGRRPRRAAGAKPRRAGPAEEKPEAPAPPDPKPAPAEAAPAETPSRSPEPPPAGEGRETGGGGPRRPPRRRRKAAGQQAVLPVDLPKGERSRLPPVELLDPNPPERPISKKELSATAKRLQDSCEEFSVAGRVDAIHPGPVVTTFEFKPEAGVKLARITGLADDLALKLGAEKVRMERIPGRSAVGIEVPNRQRQTIGLREVIESDAFRASADMLNLGLGKTQDGRIHCASLARMPHLLVAGSTGSGKSVGLNSMITSILYRARPDEVKFILVDPKMLELGIYDGMPHLLVPVVTDMQRAANAFKWAVREMERRYKVLAACNVRHLDAYNRKLEQQPAAVERALEGLAGSDGKVPSAERIPYVVIVVDELADMLMVTGQDVELAIARLAQKARAVGIHLILATQRPSVDVLTGAIKANFPARIAFQVATKIDSRTILDASGAESLLGAGDMLYRPPGSSRLIRVHGAWISEDEGIRIVDWLKQQTEASYEESILEDPEETAPDGTPGGGGTSRRDPAYRNAVELVVRIGHGSTSFLQRKLKLGYNRAARLVDQLEEDGILGPADGSKPRKTLVDPDFLERLDDQDLSDP
jgi:S-DNA-T family DNA segregation ATPase FtsK/SpoIIIE